MMLTQLDLLHLQRKLRGLRVVRAGRSVGSCLLIDLSASLTERRPPAGKPGLLVELAAWDLRRGRVTLASSRSWTRLINSAVAKLFGARTTRARVGRRGIELAFDRGFALTVTTQTPTQLGPGWGPLDQWVLFLGDGPAVAQPVRGALEWATKTERFKPGRV